MAAENLGDILPNKMPTINVSAINKLRTGFNFVVMLNEFTYGFKNVSGLQVHRETMREQEGGVNDHMYLVGKPDDDQPTLTLERGYIIRSLEIVSNLAYSAACAIPSQLGRKAAMLVASATSPVLSLEKGPSTGLIMVFDRRQKLYAIFAFLSLGMIEWSIDDLNATNNDVMIERITLAHTGIERIPLSWVPGFVGAVRTWANGSDDGMDAMREIVEKNNRQFKQRQKKIQELEKTKKYLDDEYKKLFAEYEAAEQARFDARNSANEAKQRFEDNKTIAEQREKDYEKRKETADKLSAAAKKQADAAKAEVVKKAQEAVDNAANEANDYEQRMADNETIRKQREDDFTKRNAEAKLVDEVKNKQDAESLEDLHKKTADARYNNMTTKTVTKKVAKKDENGNEVLDADGNPVYEDVEEIVATGYKDQKTLANEAAEEIAARKEASDTALANQKTEETKAREEAAAKREAEKSDLQKALDEQDKKAQDKVGADAEKAAKEAEANAVTDLANRTKANEDLAKERKADYEKRKAIAAAAGAVQAEQDKKSSEEIRKQTEEAMYKNVENVENVAKKDENGNEMLDENGNPVYETVVTYKDQETLANEAAKEIAARKKDSDAALKKQKDEETEARKEAAAKREAEKSDLQKALDEQDKKAKGEVAEKNKEAAENADTAETYNKRMADNETIKKQRQDDFKERDDAAKELNAAVKEQDEKNVQEVHEKTKEAAKNADTAETYKARMADNETIKKQRQDDFKERDDAAKELNAAVKEQDEKNVQEVHEKTKEAAKNADTAETYKDRMDANEQIAKDRKADYDARSETAKAIDKEKNAQDEKNVQKVHENTKKAQDNEKKGRT